MSRRRTDWNVSVCFTWIEGREILECYGRFWNVTGNSGMLRETLECYGRFWNVTGDSGMCKESIRGERTGMCRYVLHGLGGGRFWNVTGDSGMLR